MDLYVGGFPGTSRAITEPIFVFREGKVSANSNKVLENGYSLVYSNDTLPGMSGGAVLNSDGELVAIHGRGDRVALQVKGGNSEQWVKNGFNLGIPINRFAMVASNMGVDLGGQVAAIPQNTAPKADDYIASAAQKELKRDYRGALADLDRAIQLDLNEAFPYFLRGGLKAFKLQDIQGGLADLNRAIQLDPNNAIFYIVRGDLKALKLQDIQEYLADLNRAIQLDPDNADAYGVRGSLKVLKLQDIQGGLADSNRAIQLDPNNAEAYIIRGTIKLILNDRPGAIADVKKGAILVKQESEEAYQLAIALLKEIEGNNNKPITINTSNAESYYSQGDKKADSGNYREAIVDFDRAIALNSRYAQAYVGRGRSKYELKDYSGAISDYKQALSIAPQYASAYFNLGLVKAKQNDLKGAISDMQQAVKLYQQQGKQQDAQDAISQIKQWQQTSNNSGF